MANLTKNRVTTRTRYSGHYERPIDTPTAKAGWYVDKITVTYRPFEKSVTSVELIKFETKEEAEAFDLEHCGKEE